MGVGGKTAKKRPYNDLLGLKKDPFENIVGELGSFIQTNAEPPPWKEFLELKHRLEKIESRSLC